MSSEDHVSIEGTLLALDDETPHVAIPVQAILNGEVITTVLSDERGRYRFINLEPEKYQVRCYTLSGHIYYGRAGKSEKEAISGQYMALQVNRGKTLKNTDFRFAPFKKGVWRNYTPLDGLAGNAVNRIHVNHDGVMWFGMDGSGASRFDGKEFVNLSARHGLHPVIWDIHSSPDGVMWFDTRGGGRWLRWHSVCHPYHKRWISA